MAWILVTGFGVLVAVYIFAHPSTHTPRVVVGTVACLLGAAFASYCLNRHLKARYRQGLQNNWHLLNESGKYRFGSREKKGSSPTSAST